MVTDWIDRYAPSPTSDLHLGNLRTALAGWLLARRAGGRWLLRVEDLDSARVRAAGDAARRQLDDLASLGLEWDGDVVWQSERLDLYRDAVASLRDRTFPCFCTRADLAAAASAPHDAFRAYPGTCLVLGPREVAARAAERTPSLRVRSDGADWTIHDAHLGDWTGPIDDFPIVSRDGTFAYNLAVVVDDIAQGVTRVTRGADLLPSSPRQAWLTDQLGGTPPTYQHVGLVTDSDGVRLAKRHGSVTLADLRARGWSDARVVALLCTSLGLPPHEDVRDAVAEEPGERFWAGATWDEATLTLSPSEERRRDQASGTSRMSIT